MVVIIVTNSQMGFSCVERHGIWSSKYSHNFKYSSGFLIYQRPIFGIAPKGNKVKKNQVLSSRELNCGPISVLLKGESSNSRIPEKEFEFKPSFDEYLKAMESVKSDRQMIETPNSTRSKSKNNSRPKVDLRTSSPSKGEVENSDLGDLNENENENYNVVSTREALAFSNNDYKEIGIPKLKDATKTGVEDKRNEGRAHHLVPNNSYVKKDKMDTKVKRKLSSNTENGRWSYNQTSIDQEIQRNKKFEEHNFKADKLRYGIIGRYERDHFQDEKVSYKRNTKNSKPNECFKSILDESSDDELETERAAFKSLDFNDVYNEPRVSRVDMEERIQRLAK